MQVKDCMSQDVVCVRENATIREVSKLMLDKHIGCVPICDDKKALKGLITDRDITIRVIAIGKDPDNTKVGEIMTTEVYDIDPESEISEASKVMCDCQIKRLPVVENEKVEGIITLGDLANKRNIAKVDVGNTLKKICNCEGNPKNAQ